MLLVFDNLDVLVTKNWKKDIHFEKRGRVGPIGLLVDRQVGTVERVWRYLIWRNVSPESEE